MMQGDRLDTCTETTVVLVTKATATKLELVVDPSGVHAREPAMVQAMEEASALLKPATAAAPSAAYRLCRTLRRLRSRSGLPWPFLHVILSHFLVLLSEGLKVRTTRGGRGGGGQIYCASSIMLPPFLPARTFFPLLFFS